MLTTVITGYLIGKAIHYTATALIKFVDQKIVQPKRQIW